MEYPPREEHRVVKRMIGANEFLRIKKDGFIGQKGKLRFSYNGKEIRDTAHEKGSSFKIILYIPRRIGVTAVQCELLDENFNFKLRSDASLTKNEDYTYLSYM